MKYRRFEYSPTVYDGLDIYVETIELFAHFRISFPQIEPFQKSLLAHVKTILFGAQKPQQESIVCGKNQTRNIHFYLKRAIAI